MDSNQQHNLEKTIDALRENLAYAWQYYHVLEGLHEEAVASDSKVGRFPYLMNSIWSALFDALLLRLHHFVDKSKNVYSFYHLFKLIKTYLSSDKIPVSKISEDIDSINKESPVIQKIVNWRKQVVAHLTPSSQDSDFYVQNKIHLSEIKKFLELRVKNFNYYSVTILKRYTDTESDVFEYYDISEYKKEIKKLFKSIQAEEGA